MATRVVVIWVLMLSTGWTGVFAFFTKYYDAGEFEKRRVAVIQRDLNKNLRRVAQLELLFSEYKDTLVASGLKIKDDSRWGDPKRVLASVVADFEYKKIPKIQPGSGVLKTAQKIFASGDFARAGELLSEFVKDYPDHPGLPEAAYLLSEAQYSAGNLEASARAIDYVISHFPETEFAGYALVRLGKIFENQERPEEAAQMYELVIGNYSKSNSAVIAAKQLKELSL